MSAETYEGIDYSCGMRLENGNLPNRDQDSGIRYGVIHMGRVTQAWADSSEPIYPCEHCDCEQGDEECQVAECTPATHVCTEDGYEITSDEYGDLMISKSRFYTYAQFCSICCPGACHLNHPLAVPNANNRCYCLHNDWFDDEYDPCDYPIYSVETNELVYKPKNWDAEVRIACLNEEIDQEIDEEETK